jgi:DNA-binding MarR family transcriptional regulator
LVKLELDAHGIHDINGVQALMLFNVGDAEMTVGDLTLRGCYLGSNVSYNVKKLAENGYLAHLRSAYDRRMVHVRLTEKGLKLHDNLRAMHGRHIELLQKATAITESDLQTTAATLGRLEQFWISTPEQGVAAA